MTASSTDSPAPRAVGARVFLMFLLLVLLVASLVLLAYASVTRPVEAVGVTGEQDSVQAERDAVMSQTQQFVLRLNTYGPDQLDDQDHLPDYEKLVTAVITPKFAADFEKSGLPIAEKVVAQSGYGRSAKVFGVGVESMDEDSATAIIAAGLSGSYPDPKHPDDATKRVSTEADVLRWDVKLVKVDGKWLVDDYTLAGGGDESE